MTLTFATHNTNRGAATFRPLADICLWQECYNASVRARLRAALPGYEHATFNDRDLGAGMNSISWKRGILERDAAPWFRPASDSKPGVSPTRFVTVAPLHLIGTRRKLAAINCHFVSKAFWDPPEPDAEWRQEQWHDNLDVLESVIADVRHAGYTPIVGGDLNRHRWDLIPGLMEPRFEPLTVDRIGVPADIKATARLGTRGGSNHQPIIAKLSIPKE